MQPDFNCQEYEEITSHALLLLQKGYLTGINFIRSNQPLPIQALIVHYLQDSEEQIGFVLDHLSSTAHLKVPRITHYALDPIYTKKPNFKEEYASAQFTGIDGKPKHIDLVMNNPEDTFVTNTELDVIIPSDETQAPDLVNRLLTLESQGPKAWIHPAIIIKGMPGDIVVPGFLSKDYISVARQNAEFYSVIFDETRKQRLVKRLELICEGLKESTISTLATQTVFWHPSQINRKFDAYMEENLPPMPE